MTREDAKRILQDMWECLFNEMTNSTFDDLEEHGMLDSYSTAFDMAISALSEDKGESKHGHWEDRDGISDFMYCSNCGGKKHYSEKWIGCPYCLADMREPKGEKGVVKYDVTN